MLKISCNFKTIPFTTQACMCTCVWTHACTRVLSLNHGKRLARELLVSWCSREEDGLLSSLLGKGNGCGSSGEPQLGDLTLHCSTCCETLSALVLSLRVRRAQQQPLPVVCLLISWLRSSWKIKCKSKHVDENPVVVSLVRSWYGVGSC